jgi:hypothetical protein
VTAPKISDDNRFINQLKVFKAYDENGPIQMERLENKNGGGYVVPLKALEKADILVGYGVNVNDTSFEEVFSTRYRRQSYGFDCTIDHMTVTPQLFTFVKECIGANQTSSIPGRVFSSFHNQAQRFGFNRRKMFLKWDIEGAESEVLINNEIFPFYNDITGITIEIHSVIGNTDQASRYAKLLSVLNTWFVLVHVNGNKCCRTNFYASNVVGKIPMNTELTFINQNLLTTYHLSDNQTHPWPIDMRNRSTKSDIWFTILDD